MRNPAVWQNLKDLAFDKEDMQEDFAQVLAKRQNWDQTFAEAAVEEYRKYLYLANIANSHAAPSDLIAKVAEAHFGQKGADWDAFCAKYQGKPLNKAVLASGTDSEKQKAYLATLHLYEREFGARPDPSIWPLPKPSRVARSALPLMGIGLVICGISALGDIGQFSAANILFFGIGAFLAGVALKILCSAMPGIHNYDAPVSQPLVGGHSGGAAGVD